MSATHKAASYVAKLEGGKSQGKIHDYRQAFALLKKQHRQACRGNPSLLKMLIREANRSKK